MKCFRFSQRESKEDSSKRRKSTWWPSFSGSFGQDSRKSGSEIRSNPPSDMSAASPSLLPAVCLQPNNLRIFNLSELKAATRNFNVGNFLGEGGFGCVYKGWLRKNNSEEDVTVEVAVKLLNARGHQGHKEWLSEVKCLGLANHPNLVKLVGYCVEDDDRGLQMLLVYEFMPNRSLEAHLFGKGLPVLHWQSRLEIALGAAQGLAYLHEELEFQIIYRDFKTSNILLDKDFKPKLSDFGLARQGPDAGASHVTTAELKQFLIAVESSIGQICLPGASHFGVNTSKLVGVAVSVPYFGAQHVNS
ncbi:hypothetical protein O6H91_04G133100 [Diphasiastrum complanatum]|uniref:Uncharacterized protein n=1 Tax=Diphasiastrum complanatum TaxID=34168 RepID=A0ACC2E245_DIPCM|nr:hypothetical protein O6H91_04G133100 [Diphasiastrum complanatum]